VLVTPTGQAAQHIPTTAHSSGSSSSSSGFSSLSCCTLQQQQQQQDEGVASSSSSIVLMASHRGAAPHHSLTQLSTAAAAAAAVAAVGDDSSSTGTEPVNAIGDAPPATSPLTSAAYNKGNITGFSSAACLSRAAVWRGLQPEQLLCASGDELSNQLLVWDCSGDAAVLLHRCQPHSSPVLDVQALTVGGKQLLASVSKRDVRVLELP
jgi:hypothetical protein